jgi:hypothetical protein
VSALGGEILASSTDKDDGSGDEDEDEDEDEDDEQDDISTQLKDKQLHSPVLSYLSWHDAEDQLENEGCKEGYHY